MFSNKFLQLSPQWSRTVKIPGFCISFLLLLQQGTANASGSHYTNLLFYSSGRRLFKTSLAQQKSGCVRPVFLTETVGEDPFPCLFRLLEVGASRGSWPLLPPSELGHQANFFSCFCPRPWRTLENTLSLPG